MSAKSISPAQSTIKSIASKCTGFAGGVLLGGALATGAFTFLQSYNPPDAVASSTPDSVVVFERIVSQNEMISASQDYCEFRCSGDSDRFFDLFDIPLTDNKFWYCYAGTITAGVDMTSADIEARDGGVTIWLDEPTIVGDTPDYERTGVLDERNNIFNNIDVTDVDELIKELDQESREKVVNGGLLDEAKDNARKNLCDTFKAALGEDFQVDVYWR